MSPFSRNLLSLILIAGIAAAAAALYMRLHREGGEAQRVPAINAQLTHPEPSPTIRYPIPTDVEQPEAANEAAPAPKPIPSLDESDQTIEAALKELFGERPVEAFFNITDIVRRIVVTVDNVTQPKQPSSDFLPVKNLTSEFRVTPTDGGELSIDPSNNQRYGPYVALVRAVNARKLAAVYIRFYPLFQSAYRDLGTSGYFNDRVIDMIDNALATPEVSGPIKVTRLSEHSSYRYTDDRLEGLSAVQKLLIRMGDGNANVIKSKLRQIRALVIRVKNK